MYFDLKTKDQRNAWVEAEAEARAMVQKVMGTTGARIVKHGIQVDWFPDISNFRYHLQQECRPACLDHLGRGGDDFWMESVRKIWDSMQWGADLSAGDDVFQKDCPELIRVQYPDGTKQLTALWNDETLRDEELRAKHIRSSLMQIARHIYENIILPRREREKLERKAKGEGNE